MVKLVVRVDAPLLSTGNRPRASAEEPVARPKLCVCDNSAMQQVAMTEGPIHENLRVQRKDSSSRAVSASLSLC